MGRYGHRGRRCAQDTASRRAPYRCGRKPPAHAAAAEPCIRGGAGRAQYTHGTPASDRRRVARAQHTAHIHNGAHAAQQCDSTYRAARRRHRPAETTCVRPLTQDRPFAQAVSMCPRGAYFDTRTKRRPRTTRTSRAMLQRRSRTTRRRCRPRRQRRLRALHGPTKCQRRAKKVRCASPGGAISTQTRAVSRRRACPARLRRKATCVRPRGRCGRRPRSCAVRRASVRRWPR